MGVERYYEMWGMSINPFSVTPDMRFFYLTESHREAVEMISFAFRNGAPIVKVYGGPGTGKTTLLRYMDEKLKGTNIVSRYVLVDPLMGPSGFFEAILRAFSKRVGNFKSQRSLISRTIELIGRSGKNMVIFVDEAQDMSDRLLSFVRVLVDVLSVRFPDRDYLVVLSGNSSLKERLSGREFAALNQRSPYECELSGLKKDETYGYVLHRLRVAGFSGDELFPRRVCSMMWDAARGNPRLINMIAERALISAFVNGRKRVEKKDVKFAIGDLPSSIWEEKPKRGFLGFFREAV